MTGLEAAYSELRFVVTEWRMKQYNHFRCLLSLISEGGDVAGSGLRNLRVIAVTVVPLVSLLKGPDGSEAHCLKSRSRRCTRAGNVQVNYLYPIFGFVCDDVHRPSESLPAASPDTDRCNRGFNTIPRGVVCYLLPKDLTSWNVVQ